MANDFSGDSNCKALWSFELGALTTDSIGSNTLTDNNTVQASVDYKEGSYSAFFQAAADRYFSRNSVTIPSAFSFTGWFKLTTLSGAQTIIGQYNWSQTARVFNISVNSSSFEFGIGYNSGASYEQLYSSTTPTTGRWYHFGATFDSTDNSWKFVVYDEAGGTKIINASGTATNNIYRTSTTLTIGAINPTALGNEFDGRIDEIVYFDDVLTTGEIDQIRAGTYGSGSSPLLPTNLNGTPTTNQITWTWQAGS